MSEPTIARGVREVLTRWATYFEGGREHGGAQVARPGDLRSGCLDCSPALDVLSHARPCDLCGRDCHPAGAWALPAEQTGGVLVLLTACDDCDVHDLTDDPDPEENDVTACLMCTESLRADTLPRAWRWHPECLEAERRSRALTASGANSTFSRRLRIARAREVFARRAS